MLCAEHIAEKCLRNEYLCQHGVSGKCTHRSHIRALLTKCFNCQFHFIKYCITTAVFAVVIVGSFENNYTFFSTVLYYPDTINLFNKGSPFIG